MGSINATLDAANRCCSSRQESKSGNGADYVQQDSLEDALDSFQSKGAALLDHEAHTREWEAACGLLRALLLGPQRHLGKALSMKARVWSKNDALEEVRDSASRVLTLNVSIEGGPIRGEPATRSHLACEMVLSEVTRFSLLSPSSSSSDPIVLEVDGFTFELSPDILGIRQQLKRELGSRYTKDNVFEWWRNNTTDARLRSSKAFRIIQSLFELRSFQMTVPSAFKATIVWALVNAFPTQLTALEFADEGTAGICVHARRRLPVDMEEAQQLQLCDEILQAGLRRDRLYGDVAAPSSFNFVRMLQGHAVGLTGASTEKLTKLFTAAHTWGCGSEGWQACDDTWLVVDDCNLIGRKVRENGRLVWRFPRGRA